MPYEKPFNGRRALILQASECHLSSFRISQFFLNENELLQGQRRMRIRRGHGASERNIGFDVRFILTRSFFGERGEFLASLLRLSFPEGNERALLFDIELIDGALSHLKSAVIFLARGVEIAHE